MSSRFDHNPHDRRPLNNGASGQPPTASSPPPYDSSLHASSPPSATHIHPSAHPDSAFSRIRAQRNSGADPIQSYAPFSSAQGPRQYRNSRDLGHSHSTHTTSTITPGADDMGSAAVGGGIAGVAVGVASSNERTSGVDAARGYQYETADDMYHGPAERAPYNNPTSGNPFVPPPYEADERYNPHEGYPSNVPRGPAPAAGMFPATTGHVPTGYSQPASHRGPSEYYDDPYRGQHALAAPGVPAAINPDSIIDDGDDGLTHDSPRRSFLTLGRDSSRNNLTAGAAGGAAGGAAAGGVAGAISNRVNGQTHPGSDGGPSYDALQPEKSEWLDKQTARKKKIRWIVGIVIALLVIGGIVGGVVGGIMSKRGGNSSGSSGSGSGSAKPGSEVQNADKDTKVNGDLDKDSKQIKTLMDNSDLHKVFPGIDYTPWGTQYPDCLKFPPSQNNITRDMAVLSQLTNTVRLYGTDCNQTEMVLHAIDRLELKDMKVWLGVWIDNKNTTTNDRQLDKLYNILESADDTSIFKGVIVGNEVLFRGHQSSETLKKLSDYIDDVKSKLSKKKFDLPVATSDLGDAWTEKLAKVADVVMSNIHPFFGGVPIDDAASWTYTFWSSKNKDLAPDKPHVVAEVGWPTGGGNDCAPKDECPDDKAGAVAGIKQLNQFMDDWVCQALDNSTAYFWYVTLSF